MSEVQVDGSCLPPIQEVCRDFAILEDGALAHCLQEQEIEQHYTSNVQKNQLVQKDLQMAKRLQDMEDKAIQQKQDEEHDLELAQGIQDKMQRKAEETTHWRKEQGQGAAKGSKEKETQGSRQQRQRRGNSRGTKDDGCAGRHLDWQMAELELQSERQLQQDEALAWKLQEEEQACLRAKKNRERNDDYRVAQVAQDEEIARYIQDQELKAQWAPPSKDPPAAGALGQRRSPQKAVQESFVAAPRISIQPLESSSVYPRGPQAVIRPQLCRNIAEDLDPTFRTRKLELPTKVTTSCSPAATQAHPVIVDGSFDYPGEGAESAFVSPSKRHPDKVGRRKPRDKREGCKQQ